MLEGTCTFQVQRMGPSVHQHVKSQASRKGCAMVQYVRPFIKTIIDSYPAYMSEAPAPKKKTNFTIQGMSRESRRKIENISTHLGVDVGDLIKVEVARIQPQVNK